MSWVWLVPCWFAGVLAVEAWDRGHWRLSALLAGAWAAFGLVFIAGVRG